MGCKYVKDFDFGPAKTYVKGYARGGPVKKADCGCAETPARKSVPVAPKGPLIVIAMGKKAK